MLVGVGYMDPGNWGTDIAAGARFGYSLLWVVALANAMGILVQYLSAKLGLSTRRTLAEMCRLHLSRRKSLFLWATAEVAATGTDLAEVLGGALAIHLLFGLPMFTSALIISLDVFLILGLQKWGYRKLEVAIIAFVATIGMAYVYELALAGPDWPAVAYHVVTPELNSGSVLIAVGILGATVMPHNVFLHSSLVQSRVNNGNGFSTKKLHRFALADTVVALLLAGIVNASILIMAASVFYRRGIPVDSIEMAHRTLEPLLGGYSSLAFAIALLASGLSSSTTATLAGQVIMEGFLNLKIRLWLRRLFTRAITLVPALIAIAIGIEPLQLLVVSQAILSLQLPFTVVPLLYFTGRRKFVGESVNSRPMNAAASIVAFVIILLNVLLIVQVLGGTF